ncbi:cysteine desulfurase-like protein [Gephyromycinifex aptenodytis]|uniref:cysteine desulfurase-like protein n=1 Tax=Gephyromycinifex aptenodytis TaxID=2716227 RepID=UPI0014477576|nr:cysteine desulfurase-like protein [Gephyromycinifex aptenodytis]
MSYDVEQFRLSFPALADGTCFFDAPGGTQTPRNVAQALADTMTSGISNRDCATASGRRAEETVLQARAAIGDLLNVEPGGVVFGRSMTALTYEFSRTLAAGWGPGDEIVLTRLDHDSNVRPWMQAAQRAGAAVRLADFDPATGELAPEAVTDLITERTRLVALTAASNLIGTRPDLPSIARRTHQVGALLFVDGVHYTAHAPVDVAELGADVYVCSPYKFLGPHCGVLAADPAFLESLHPDKLLPSSDAVPERFELGTLPYELLAGTTAAVDTLASLGQGPTRRAALLAAMAAVQEHEDRLRERLEKGLLELGATIFSRAAHRTPTLLARFPGISDQQVHSSLAAAGINAPAGNFYAIECSRHLGLGEGGAVRLGLAPYSNDEDIDRLLAKLAVLVRAD